MRRLAVEPLEDRVVPATYFFENAANIAIPNSGAATPNPSPISVASLTGTVTNVTVTLVNYNHTFPDDVAVLLQAPGGGTVELMRNAGGGIGGVDATDVANVTYTFADGAAALSDGGPFSPAGTYRPSQYGGAVAYPAPAPAGPFGTTLSSLNGSNPNGTWNLFAFDDAAGDVGSFAGGWQLAVTTDTGADFAYNFATNPGVNTFLRANGANYEIADADFGGTVFASQPAPGTTSITVTGRDGSSDVFVVTDFGGPIAVPVSFAGGIGSGRDDFRLQNFIGGSVAVAHADSAGGTVQIAGAPLLTFTQTERLVFDRAAADLTITLPAGPNTDAVMADDTPATFPALGISLPERSALDAATFAYTEFRNPSTSLSVNLGNGGDTITLRAMDPTFAPTNGVVVTGGAGADTFVVAAALTRTSGAGGAGDDRLVFTAGASLGGGAFDGGANTDTLDYTAYTTPVAANLGLGVAGLTATLDGGQESPTTGSPATGTATISNYNAATKTFDLTLAVTGLAPADVTGLHLQRGGVGLSGPIVLDLLGMGTLVPAGTGFTLTLTGLDLDNSLLGGAANEAAFLGGQTYLNIRTAAFPTGATRGQVFSTGNVALGSGTATGTSSVAGVENVTGGAAADSLVGTTGVNVLSGLGGNDTLLGGPGSDVFLGGDNDDTLIWSNGDGSDTMDGEAGIDTVAVNGNLTADDVFTVGVNGTRVDFDRVSPGVFSLNIGTTENLRVNGAGGNDSFAANVPAGTALVGLTLNGLAGTDTFDVTPSTGVVVRADGGTGTDTLTVELAGTTNPFLTTAADPAGGVAGNFMFGGLNPVSFAQVEDPEPPANFLTVTKTDGLSTATAGTTLTYTVTVTNNGSVGLSNVTVSDLFPPELTGVTWTAAFTPGSSGAASGSGDIAELVNLAAGGSVTYTVTAKLRTDVVGSFTNTATATVPAGLVDSNPADNTATDTTQIRAGLPTALVVTGPGGGSGLRFSSSGGQLTAPQAVSFFPGFLGEIHVAQGDVDGDGVLDIVAATGFGAGVFRVLRGTDGNVMTQLEPFPGYTGGLFVAVGDLTGDGRADIAVMPDAADAFTGPINRELPVRVFSGADFSLLAAFNGLADLQGRSGENDGTRLGGRPAIADVNGDGTPDLLVAAGNGGGPRVTVWSGLGFPGAAGGKPTVNPITNLFVFESSQRGGAFVTAGDVNGDGVADIIVGGGPGGGPRVRIVDGAKLFGLSNLDVNLDDPANLANGLVLNNFFAGDLNRRGGLRVAVVDMDADGRADLVTGSGTGEASSVRVYTGPALAAAFGSSSEPGVNQVLDPFAAVVPGGVFVG